MSAPIEHSLLEIVAFFAFILFFLWLDLHKHQGNKAISAKNALMWTGLWVSLAMCFMGYIWVRFGSEPAQLFLAGYLLEESLAVDNLFVIMAIFGSFGIKDEYQHRVLYYGILGALIMRFIFIMAGTKIVDAFGVYALAVFGIFVLWTAWKMWQQIGKESAAIEDYTDHWAVRLTQRFIPVHPQLEGQKFFVREEQAGSAGIWKATPLFLCLIVVEMSDVMFAFDSVPAIIAITRDPFLVYTSNVFAILGLRSMYFLLAAAKRYLRHLEKSVVAILAFIGIKMLMTVADVAHLPPMASLGVVAGLLFMGIAASFIPEKEEQK